MKHLRIKFSKYRHQVIIVRIATRKLLEAEGNVKWVGCEAYKCYPSTDGWGSCGSTYTAEADGRARYDLLNGPAYESVAPPTYRIRLRARNGHSTRGRLISGGYQDSGRSQPFLAHVIADSAVRRSKFLRNHSPLHAPNKFCLIGQGQRADMVWGASPSFLRTQGRLCQKWNISNFDKVNAYHERAALNPETAVVAVIGYGYDTNKDKILAVNAAVAGAFLNVKKPREFKIMEFAGEKEILEDWISSMSDQCNTAPHGAPTNAGFAIKHFDLPFIRKRCWLLGIPFPRIFSAGRLSGYMWDENFIDLQEVWASGDRTVRVAQDYLCTVFGLETKPSEGKLFWKYLRDDPAAAFLYAAHDINTIVKLGDRMGIVRKTTALGLL